MGETYESDLMHELTGIAYELLVEQYLWKRSLDPSRDAKRVARRMFDVVAPVITRERDQVEPQVDTRVVSSLQSKLKKAEGELCEAHRRLRVSVEKSMQLHRQVAEMQSKLQQTEGALARLAQLTGSIRP